MAWKNWAKVPMRLEPQNFLAKTAGMTNEEVGAYMRLLLHAWDPPPAVSGDPPQPGHLPNESDLLERKSNAHERWPAVSRSVLRLFGRSEDDSLLVDEQIVEQYRRSRCYASQTSANALNGATAVSADVVYFAHNEERGVVKIGCSGNVGRRLVDLQRQKFGRPALRLIAVLRGGYAKEAELHRRFVALRVEGEWFRATDELLLAARSLDERGRAAG